jgi:uncharacterized lipoprotein NlpE involved in copper resistance
MSKILITLMAICFITMGCQQEKTITLAQIKVLFQNHGIQISEPTDLHSENAFLITINDVTPEIFTIDESQLICVYLYSSIEESNKGYKDFEEKIPASDEIWYRGYQVANLILFYVPIKGTPQYEQFDLIFEEIQSLAK